jgi:serine/arginine repetitive matrix protein 2
MRSEQPVTAPASSMRTSMRGEQPSAPSHTMRHTMRGTNGPSGLAASRFAHEEAPHQHKGALQKRNIPSAPRPTSSGGLANSRHAPAKIEIPIKPPPLPSGYDSDASESSFRRERRRPSSSGGGFAMRRTMRGGPTPGAPAPSLRPQSPPESKSSKFRIRSMSPAGSLSRKSLRDHSTGYDSSNTTPTKEKTGFFGRSKKGKGIPPVPALPAAMSQSTPKSSSGKSPNMPKLNLGTSKFKSRFADSSDEDEDEPRTRMTFKSRFADSDDESDPDISFQNVQLPPGLTPVRGIPRRPGEEDGDSTDLEDEESDVEAQVKKGAGNVRSTGEKVNGVAGGAGKNLEKGTLRGSIHATQEERPIEASTTTTITGGKEAGVTKQKSKRSFFGFGKRKDKDKDSLRSGQLSTVPERSTPPPTTAPTQPMLDKATKDEEIEAETPASPISPIAASPTSPTRSRSPKLQRRSAPQRVMSDSWPLPPASAEDERPGTADGVPGIDFKASESLAKRPTFGQRISSFGQSSLRTDGGAPMDISKSSGASRRILGRGRGSIVFEEGGGSETGELAAEERPAKTVLRDEKGHVYSERTGRKKKFPMLRKVFGLDD